MKESDIYATVKLQDGAIRAELVVRGGTLHGYSWQFEATKSGLYTAARAAEAALITAQNLAPRWASIENMVRYEIVEEYQEGSDDYGVKAVDYDDLLQVVRETATGSLV